METERERERVMGRERQGDIKRSEDWRERDSDRQTVRQTVRQSRWSNR